MSKVYKSRITKYMYKLRGDDILVLIPEEFEWEVTDAITWQQIESNSNFREVL